MKKQYLQFIIVLSFLFPIQSFAQVLDTNICVTNGFVNAMATDGNYIYIGGYFSYVGPNTGNTAKLTTMNHNPDMDFPRVFGGTYGGIKAIVSDGNGGWYIGGSFTKVGNYLRNNIAHINANKTVDAIWNPNANSTVYTILISGNDMYVGGAFTSIGGLSRNRIAKLNTITGIVDTTWNANANEYVQTIAKSGNDIYAGGAFNFIGGFTRNKIAKLNDSTGTADTLWNANANNNVKTIAISGNDIYVGGYFTNIGGVNRTNIVKLNNTSGAANASWNANSSQNGSVNKIVIDGNSIYAGGDFGSLGGQTRKNIAKLNNTSGTADVTWNPNSNDDVYEVVINGNDMYVGGVFSNIGGQNMKNLAKLNKITGLSDINWYPNPSAGVSSISIYGNDIFIGGGFTSVRGQTRNCLAKINRYTGVVDSIWDPNVNQIVGSYYQINTIAISGNDIYVGGDFPFIGGLSRNLIAKLNNTTGAADSTWNPFPLYSWINTITIEGNDIYAGGSFDQIGYAISYNIQNIAKLNNSTGAPDPIWSPQPNYEINTITISGNDMYVGGNFTNIGGQARNYLAKLNKSTGAVDATWNPNANNAVATITINGSDVYIGGSFTTIGGQYRKGIAKLNNTTGAIDPTWNLNANAGIRAIAFNGNDLYIGGNFTSINGQSRNRIAKLNITGALDATWNPNATGSSSCIINSIVINGNEIYVGGNFSNISGHTIMGFAKYIDNNIVVSIKEPQVNYDGFNIYPNPATSKLIIESSQTNNSTLSIFNLCGQEVLKQNVTGTPTTINVGNLKTGVYFLRLQREKGVEMQKFVKE